jgi:hypothetical protein
MSCLWYIFLGSLFQAAEPADRAAPPPVRYLKQAGGKFVLESEITETRHKDGTAYVSLTVRPQEKMTLALRFDKAHKLISARAVHQAGKTSSSATLTFQGTKAVLKRSGRDAEVLADAAPDSIVTTAPDWSDIFQLVHRYDRARGGRQEFPGLWIHPVKAPLRLTFSIKRVGKDTIRGNDKKIVLERFKIQLRSGAYLAWADRSSRVYKLMVPGKPNSSVVLEEYQEQTRALGK